MALIVADRVQETCNAPGTGVVTLLGAVAQFQTFSAAIGNGNTTYYVIADQTGANWEVGIGTYATTGNTLTRTTILASSNAGSLVNFATGTQNVWGDLPAGKAIYKDASGNAIGLGTPAAFVGTNITGTASGLTSGNVTTNANLTGAVTSVGNAASLGSFTSLELATALTDETGTGANVFATSPTLVTPILGTPTSGTLTNCTFPILNQNTTGSSASCTGNAATATSLTTIVGSAPSYACRAWVNFNGGTVAISASGNVSSITHNGVGDYTINFTTAMPDANYSVVGMTRQDAGGGSGPWGSWVSIKQGTTLLATSVRVVINIISNSAWTGIGGGVYDAPEVCVSIFR